jgi:hypothetical protein
MQNWLQNLTTSSIAYGKTNLIAPFPIRCTVSWGLKEYCINETMQIEKKKTLDACAYTLITN